MQSYAEHAEHDSSYSRTQNYSTSYVENESYPMTIDEVIEVIRYEFRVYLIQRGITPLDLTDDIQHGFIEALDTMTMVDDPFVIGGWGGGTRRKRPANRRHQVGGLTGTEQVIVHAVVEFLMDRFPEALGGIVTPDVMEDASRLAQHANAKMMQHHVTSVKADYHQFFSPNGRVVARTAPELRRILRYKYSGAMLKTRRLEDVEFPLPNYWPDERAGDDAITYTFGDTVFDVLIAAGVSVPSLAIMLDETAKGSSLIDRFVQKLRKTVTPRRRMTATSYVIHDLPKRTAHSFGGYAFSAFSVAELKNVARARGDVPGFSRMTKAELQAALGPWASAAGTRKGGGKRRPSPPP